MDRLKKAFLSLLAWLRDILIHGIRACLHLAQSACLTLHDLTRLVDVNDFGRYISRNLGRRFIALSGVVTLFALMGDYTKTIVYGSEAGGDISANFIENFKANFIFFGIPGALLLMSTQLFSFFNRANYFTAQANFLNLLETPKRTPAQLDKLIHKLWNYVYRSEFSLKNKRESHTVMCNRVREIQRAKVAELSRLTEELAAQQVDLPFDPQSRENLGPIHRGAGQSAEAREKYEKFMHRIKVEGYMGMRPWDRMSLQERCSATVNIIKAEIVDEIRDQGYQACETGFRFNARWALTSPMHLNLKHRKTGIDLKLVEDWMDGAIFDLTDIKLIEQYMAEATLKSAKIQARIPLFSVIMVQGMRSAVQRIWTQLVFGITSKRIGRYLNHLNNRYAQEKGSLFDKDYFKAEAFLWQSREYDRQIRDEMGREALIRLKKLRTRWLYFTLGRLKKPFVHRFLTVTSLQSKVNRNTVKAIRTATRMIKRMFAGSVYNIHELRLIYDPDYVILMANRDQPELERMGFATTYLKRHRPALMKRHREVISFMSRVPALLSPEALMKQGLRLTLDDEAIRAVRVAYHINENNFKKQVDREQEKPSGHTVEIYRAIESIVKNKASYSRKIRKLKTYETLAIHHLKSYINNITRIYRNLQQHHRKELLKILARKKGRLN